MTFSKSLATDGLSATAVKAVANPAQALKSTTVDFDRVNVGVATEDNQFLDNNIKESQKLKKEISKLQKDTRNLNTQILEAKNNGNNKEQNRLLQEKICIQNEIKIEQEKLNKLITPDGSFNQNTQLKNDLSDRRVTDDNPTSILDLAAVSGFVKNLGIATVGLVVGFGALQGQAHATSFNMIENGEFDNTTITGSWDSLDPRYSNHLNSDSFHWDSKAAYDQHSYLKQQGYSNVDETGSDGLATGNFFAGHSNNWRNGEYSNISQTFTLGENIDRNALFSFDYATHSGNRSWMQVILKGSESGTLLNDNFYVNDTSWTEYEFDFDVVAGEEITVTYYGVGQTAIDDVSFLVNKKIKAVKRKVPESGSILGLVGVTAVVGFFPKTQAQIFKHRISLSKKRPYLIKSFSNAFHFLP